MRPAGASAALARERREYQEAEQQHENSARLEWAPFQFRHVRRWLLVTDLRVICQSDL